MRIVDRPANATWADKKFLERKEMLLASVVLLFGCDLISIKQYASLNAKIAKRSEQASKRLIATK